MTQPGTDRAATRMSLLARHLWVGFALSVTYLLAMASLWLGVGQPTRNALSLAALVAGGLTLWSTRARFRTASRRRLRLTLALSLSGALAMAAIPVMRLDNSQPWPLYALLLLPVGGFLGIVLGLFVPWRRHRPER